MWKNRFDKILPLLGHRNWILVVDKAYPLQSSNGIEYLDSQQPLEDVLEYVLGKIEESNHIKPILYKDKEALLLPHFGGMEAEMVERIEKIIRGKDVATVLHDDIFKKIDTASKLFNIVVIKTESTVAYSSIFIELDCKYWNSDKEDRLRELLTQI